MSLKVLISEEGGHRYIWKRSFGFSGRQMGVSTDSGSPAYRTLQKSEWNVPGCEEAGRGGNIGTDDQRGKQEDTGRGRELDTSGEDKRAR